MQTLTEVIAAVKSVYERSIRDQIGVAYAGRNFVDPEGNVWYEITTSEPSGIYTAWSTIIDGEPVTYDGDRLAEEDRLDFPS